MDRLEQDSKMLASLLIEGASSFPDTATRILKALSKSRKAKWAVVGGHAVALWGSRGVPTLDVDFIGDKESYKIIRDEIGKPYREHTEFASWKAQGDPGADFIHAKLPFLKYALKHSIKSRDMTVINRVGAAVMKLAAVNNIFRVYGKAGKAPQDIADLLNLTVQMTDAEKKEFIKASGLIGDHAVEDAKSVIKHVEDGDAVTVSIYQIPAKKS